MLLISVGVMRVLSAIARLSANKNCPHDKRLVGTLLVGLLCNLAASRATAHPAAAEPPTFHESDCITVVDKATQNTLSIGYDVLTEDTSIGTGDIPVSDAKTHQFYAVQGTVYPFGVDDVLVPFADPKSEGVLLPLWITHSDVQRAAAASAMATGVTQDQTDLPAEAVLESRRDLEGLWLRITADDARRPITRVAARMPVVWDLSGVAPGVYSVLGYIFSPPFNAWARRAGVVKVKDGERDPLAGELAAIKEAVFSYQGRRVRGCLDVPSGSKLSAFYHVEEKPELGWLPWVTEQPVVSGEQSLCLHVDRSDIVGSIRVRWDLHAPDGEVVTSVRSKDTLTWLQGKGACKESEQFCCDFPGAVTEEATPPEAAVGQGGTGGAVGIGGATGSAGSAADGGGTSSRASDADGGGCSAASPRGQRGTPTYTWLLALGLCARWRSRRVNASGRRAR